MMTALDVRTKQTNEWKKEKKTKQIDGTNKVFVCTRRYAKLTTWTSEQVTPNYSHSNEIFYVFIF